MSERHGAIFGAEASLDLVKRFWISDPARDLPAVVDEAAHASRGRCERLSIGTTVAGRPIVGARVGRGPTRLVVIAGVHGHEPYNAFGMLLFLSVLLFGAGPDGEDLSAWAGDLLARQSIYLLPLVNADAAARFARRVPNCWLRARYGDGDHDEVSGCINEPLRTYGLVRGSPGLNRLTAAQVHDWTVTRGQELGWLFNDEGVDIWEDWQRFDAPETRALRDFLDAVEPTCVFELHNHEKPSNMFVPLPSSRGPAARLQLRHGEELMTRLRAAGVPCTNHSVRTYAFKEAPFQQLPDVVQQRHRCLVLFGEASMGFVTERLRAQMRGDPLACRDADAALPTQEEIIRTVFVWLRALADLGSQGRYA